MTYESWRISFQSSEQAARAAYAKVEELAAERDALTAKVRELEAELREDHWPYGATVKLIWSDDGSGYRATVGWAKRDQAGALVSAYSLSPLDPDCWIVSEERYPPPGWPDFNPQAKGD